jgi:hypothetical protein
MIFFGNQAKDDALEAKSVMVLFAVAKNEEISRMREHCRVIDFLDQGSWIYRWHRVDSAFCANRTVVKSKSIQVPLDYSQKQIYSGKAIWTATKRFQYDGKYYDMVSILIL